VCLAISAGFGASPVMSGLIGLSFRLRCSLLHILKHSVLARQQSLLPSFPFFISLPFLYLSPLPRSRSTRIYGRAAEIEDSAAARRRTSPPGPRLDAARIRQPAGRASREFFSAGPPGSTLASPTRISARWAPRGSTSFPEDKHTTMGELAAQGARASRHRTKPPGPRRGLELIYDREITGRPGEAEGCCATPARGRSPAPYPRLLTQPEGRGRDLYLTLTHVHTSPSASWPKRSRRATPSGGSPAIFGHESGGPAGGPRHGMPTPSFDTKTTTAGRANPAERLGAKNRRIADVYETGLGPSRSSPRAAALEGGGVAGRTSGFEWDGADHHFPRRQGHPGPRTTRGSGCSLSTKCCFLFFVIAPLDKNVGVYGCAADHDRRSRKPVPRFGFGPPEPASTFPGGERGILARRSSAGGARQGDYNRHFGQGDLGVRQTIAARRRPPPRSPTAASCSPPTWSESFEGPWRGRGSPSIRAPPVAGQPVSAATGRPG